MNIQVIGTGCDDCDKLYENVKKAVENIGISADICKVEDLMEIVKLGVMTSPSLLIDGRLVISGTAASVGRVEKCIRKALS